MTTKSADNDRSGNVRRLSDAVRRVRIAEAERTDAFADLYETDRARLSLVAEELAGVFAELPDDDFFVCTVAGSTPPRLWIDATSHVVMARDRRTYRFLKDTRLGRIVLLESADQQAIADGVTDYIAERIVERERAVETDFLLTRMRKAAMPAPTSDDAETTDTAAPSNLLRTAHPVAAELPRQRRSGLLGTLLLVVLGAVIGAFGLITYAWFMGAH